MRNLLLSFVCVFTMIPALALANEIALVQYNADAHFGNYDHNLRQLTKFADEAVAHGSKIIVFPEGSTYGYAGGGRYWCAPDRTDAGCVDVRQAAESIPDGKTSSYWKEFASKYQVYILFNLPEAARNGRFYNTTAVFGPSGFVTRYRKRSLYVTDTFYASRGDQGAVVLATPYGNFGLLICMDANYDDYYSEYLEKGVDRLIIPMDWDQDPNGLGGARPARTYFQQKARQHQMDLFVSDVSPWDGTGAYLRDRKGRERWGLPAVAIGIDGVTYHPLN